MSTMLYRLGALAYERRWWVLTGWLMVLAALATVLLVNPVRLSTEVRIDGTPAQRVVDQLSAQLPEASGGQGIIAFQAPDGTRIDQGAREAALLDAVNRVYISPHVIDARKVLAAEAAKGPSSPMMVAAGAVAKAQADLQASAQVTAGSSQPATAAKPLAVNGQLVPGVIVSADGSVALFQFQFDAQTYVLPPGTVQDTIDAAEQATLPQGIAVLPSSTMIQIPEIFGVGEAIGVAIAAIVLVITLGSLVAAGLPLVTALLGIAVGVGGAFGLSHVIQIHSLAAVLALMLGLAVGMDYALFIVNRQRRLVLDKNLSAKEAAARAVGTAGSAVFFAGTTVIIALVALSVVQIKLLTTMSLIAAVTVAVAVTISLTVLPALLGFAGERIVSTRARERSASAAAGPSRHRVATAWAQSLVRHRYLASLLAIGAAATIAVPATDMQLGLPAGASYNAGTTQRQSYDVVADRFGKGFNGPLLVVATATAGRQAISPQDLAALYTSLATAPGVAVVNLAGVNSSGSTAILTITPTTGPTDAETASLVRHLRAQAPDLAAAHHTTVGVTGFAALAIDVSDRLSEALPLYIGVVLALSLVVLLLVFRSVLVPIKATAGFLLSVSATFGATTAVFQWGWLQTVLGIDATSPVLSMLPIMVTGVLYGLAMDYEVFLVSSIKEAHVHGHHGHDTIVHGFTQASRVVVAAAVIMTAVFAGFAFNPDPMVKQIGFALAIGILIDAFLVRMTLVPAVMAVFGDRAWWLPRFLDRLLPNVDIEGDKLTTRLAEDPSAVTTQKVEYEDIPASGRS